jgi:hypothetical protein
MTYYGTDSRRITAHQIMKRILVGLNELNCGSVIHVKTSDAGGERLISKVTGVEVAHIDKDFRVNFSNPRGESTPYLPGGISNPTSMEQVLEVVNAVLWWLKEESPTVPAGEHSVYEGRIRFYVTFGQLHPLRDGYVEIWAYTEAGARTAAFEILGQKWSSLSMVPCDLKSFPEGVYGRPIVADDHEP